MAYVHSSFLVRWWRVRDGQRIEVAHIQSGKRVVVASLAAAAAWMDACVGAAPGTPSTSTSPSDAGSGADSAAEAALDDRG